VTSAAEALMVNGGRVLPRSDFGVEHVELESIALGLSRIHRFHGQSSWTVARHSLLVASALPPELRPWGLLHDAAEALVTGDCPTPLKTMAFRRAEDSVLRVVADRFGLDWPAPPEVKAADTRALRTEVEDEFGLPAARALAPRVRPLDASLLPPGRCRRAWLEAAAQVGIS
jgi:hypothetical protein